MPDRLPDQMHNDSNGLPRVNRRIVVAGTGAALAAGVPGLFQLAALSPDEVSALLASPAPGSSEFFSPEEAAVVDAIVARIIPGDTDDPGAREAGVTTYINRMLTTIPEFAEPTYHQPPFARGYSGDTPPPPEPDVIWVPEDQLERYGFQSPLTPHESYRRGLAALEQYTRGQFDTGFADLSASEQDEVITALATGEAEGFDEPSSEQFFELIWNHTVQGMFADPIYGGNRNLAGWRLVGFPGAQRGYTPRELTREGTTREPMSLADLSPFHPGRPDNEHVVLPVSGSDLHRDQHDE